MCQAASLSLQYDPARIFGWLDDDLAPAAVARHHARLALLGRDQKASAPCQQWDCYNDELGWTQGFDHGCNLLRAISARARAPQGQRLHHLFPTCSGEANEVLMGWRVAEGCGCQRPC